MARGWTPKKTKEEMYQDTVRDTERVIRSAMGEMCIRSLAEAAEVCGMRASTFAYKAKHGGWKQQELCNLIEKLHISDENALRLVRYAP